MTRDEMHRLLDAAFDLNDSQSRYEVAIDFYLNTDGNYAANYFISDNNIGKDICTALNITASTPKSMIVASGIVADSCKTVYDALRVFAHYKEDGKHENQ